MLCEDNDLLSCSENSTNLSFVVGVHVHKIGIIFLPEIGRSLAGVQDSEYFMMSSCVASKLKIRLASCEGWATSSRQ